MLEVFTVGGGEYIVNVFNAVAAWSGGGGYRSLIRVVMVMGLIYALLSMAWSLDARVLWKWFIQATAMYLVLMVPTTSVKVTDRVNPGLAPAVVSNVPLGLGMMASFTSQVGDWLTRSAETVFVMPNALNYSTGGMIYGARLLEGVQQQQVRDSAVATNLDEYMKSCLFYDILIHGKDIQTIMESPNLLQAIGPGSASLAMVWRNPDPAATPREEIVSCTVGYTRTAAAVQAKYPEDSARIAREMYPNLADAAALAKFTADAGSVGYAGLGSGQTSAQQLTQQAMMIDALLKARANFGNSSAQAAVDAFAQQRAEVQTRNTYSTIAGGAMKWVPLLNIVLTVVFYAMFPVIFLLMLLPNGGLGVAKGYLTGFFYLASWGPLFVVLNMIFMSRWQSALGAVQNGGLTASNFASVSAINQDAAALAGYMIMSVPFIAAGMAKGAMSIASHSASFLAPSQSAAEQAGAEATTGNRSYGNTSLANRTVNTETVDQHRTAPTYDVGTGMVNYRNADGTVTSTTADGSTVYNVQGGMSNLAMTPTMTDDFIRDQRQVLSRGQAVVESKRQAESEAWTSVASNGVQLLDSAEKSVASGHETGSGVNSSLSRVNSMSESLSRQLQDTFSMDKAAADQIARESVMSGRFSLSGGVGAVFGGGAGKAGANGEAGVSSAARRVSNEELRTGEGFRDVRDYVNRSVSSEEAREARDTFSRDTSSSSDREVRSVSEKYDASVSQAVSATREASRAEEVFERYSDEVSQSESNGFRLSRNMSQEFVEFALGEMSKPGNEWIGGTGYHPGLPTFSGEQREINNTLYDRFLEGRLDKMEADLGVMPGPADFKIDGPVVGGAEGVREFGAANMARIRGDGPKVDVRDSSYDSGLAGKVSGRIDDEAARISDGGREFRLRNFNERMAGDAVRDSADRRNHSSLGGTTPVVSQVLDGLGVPGTPSNPFSSGEEDRSGGGGGYRVARLMGGAGPGSPRVDLPVAGGSVRSRFGRRSAPVAGASRDHNGVDIAAPRGTPIRTQYDGKVIASGFDRRGGGGNFVRIDHGNGIVTGYAHMDRPSPFKAGDSVSAGTQVGSVGTTGRSTGPHLHYTLEVDGKKVDPLSNRVIKE